MFILAVEPCFNEQLKLASYMFCVLSGTPNACGLGEGRTLSCCNVRCRATWGMLMGHTSWLPPTFQKIEIVGAAGVAAATLLLATVSMLGKLLKRLERRVTINVCSDDEIDRQDRQTDR